MSEMDYFVYRGRMFLTQSTHVVNAKVEDVESRLHTVLSGVGSGKLRRGNSRSYVVDRDNVDVVSSEDC